VHPDGHRDPIRAIIIYLEPTSPLISCAVYPFLRRTTVNTRRHFETVWPCTPWGLPGHSSHLKCRWALTPPFHPSPVSLWGDHRLDYFLLHVLSLLLS